MQRRSLASQSETLVEHTVLPRVARTVILSRPDLLTIRFSTENDPLGATVVRVPLHAVTPLSTSLTDQTWPLRLVSTSASTSIRPSVRVVVRS